MRKVSIVGIDKTGKTSIVKSLNNLKDIETIHLTICGNNSNFGKLSNKIINKLTNFGEKHNLKSLTGLSYLLHLNSYYLKEKTKSSHPLLVSDRDPIIDTLCYSDFYLPNKISRLIKPKLKDILEDKFGYPDSYIHLEVSPEVSLERCNEQNQLHEKFNALYRLDELFKKEISNVKKMGVNVIKINTNHKPLEEVTNEVKNNLYKINNQITQEATSC